MSGERKGMGVMVAVTLSQAVHAVLLLRTVHPAYVAAVLLIIITFTGSFMQMTA